MSIYPSVITTLSFPGTTDKLNSPSHSALETGQSSAIGQLQAFIGLSGDSSTAGTLLYDIRSSDSDGGGHIQTANKGGTGQTTFTKGDLLVAQSTSVLTKIAVGDNGTVLKANPSTASGVEWTSGLANITSFAGVSSVLWTYPSALGMLFVQLWAGGGSGGSGVDSDRDTGGLGGCCFAEAWITPSILQGSQLVYIGAGGASVTGNANGANGSNTVFGSTSILVAYGGSGGQSATTGASGGGSAGPFGISSTLFAGVGGDSGVNGQDGIYCGGGGGDRGNGGNAIHGGAGGGGIQGTTAGNGGTSRLGGNGGSASVGGNGTAGSFPSGGGAGAHVTGGGFYSGKGGDGLVIISEYI